MPRSLCQLLTLRGRILESSVGSALKFINLRKLEPQGSLVRGNSISLQRVATERLFGPRYGTARFRGGNSARLFADSKRPESTQSRECLPIPGRHLVQKQQRQVEDEDDDDDELENKSTALVELAHHKRIHTLGRAQLLVDQLLIVPDPPLCWRPVDRGEPSTYHWGTSWSCPCAQPIPNKA